jgi:hypothetical protein
MEGEVGSLALEFTASQLSSLFAGISNVDNANGYDAHQETIEFSSSQLSQLFAGMSNSSWSLKSAGERAVP